MTIRGPENWIPRNISISPSNDFPGSLTNCHSYTSSGVHSLLFHCRASGGGVEIAFLLPDSSQAVNLMVGNSPPVSNLTRFDQGLMRVRSVAEEKIVTRG